jgi:hypothetical protein
LLKFILFGNLLIDQAMNKEIKDFEDQLNCYPEPGMLVYDHVETIMIHADTKMIWDYITDYERTWMPSNPEHISHTTVNNDKRFRDSSSSYTVEHVGRAIARMIAVLSDVVPYERWTWSARAMYSGFMGLSLRVNEVGNFHIQPTPKGSRITHRIRVWFPDTLKGRMANFLYNTVGSSRAAGIRHTRVELEYYKEQIEKSNG